MDWKDSIQKLDEPWKTWLRSSELLTANDKAALIAIPNDALLLVNSLEGAALLMKTVRQCLPTISIVIPIDQEFGHELSQSKVALHTVHARSHPPTTLAKGSLL